jgi:DNA-binding response OmpR family regulator
LIYALSNGADDYLVRPVSPSMLEAKLRHYARVLAMQSRAAALLKRN